MAYTFLYLSFGLKMRLKSLNQLNICNNNFQLVYRFLRTYSAQERAEEEEASSRQKKRSNVTNYIQLIAKRDE